MKNEEWRPIKMPVDLTGVYEISNCGRVKRLGYWTKYKPTFKPDLIRSNQKVYRYAKVSIKVNGVNRNFSVHRLVCWAFLEKPEGKDMVNHKNGIKSDNRVENLEWCTHTENVRHAQAIGLVKYAKPKPPKPPKTDKHGIGCKPVINIETGVIYKSTGELSGVLNKSIKTLRRSLSGERYNSTPYRYFENGKVVDNAKLPPVKVVKPTVEKVKFVRPPRKQYVPHPLQTKKVAMFDEAGLLVMIFDSAKIAAEHVKTSKDTFRKTIKRSPRGFHKGFYFNSF